MTNLELIKIALKEDLPQGDITTEALSIGPKIGTARLLAKQDLVLSGSSLFDQTLMLLEPNIQIRWHFNDGDMVLKGQSLCSIHGDLLQALKGERVGLNFLIHLSGIATHTRQFVDQLKGSKIKILDTRKTLPGYRELQKKAVKDGGGTNHRMSLSDALLIKDNHIALAGGVTEAIKRVQNSCDKPITIEVSTAEQIKEAVALNVDRLLIDNVSTQSLKDLLPLVPEAIYIEVSGNITLQRLAELKELDIDFISSGALTHSSKSADISLQFDWT